MIIAFICVYLHKLKNMNSVHLLNWVTSKGFPYNKAFLSDYLGISVEYLNKVINGKGKLSGKCIGRLANLYEKYKSHHADLYGIKI